MKTFSSIILFLSSIFCFAQVPSENLIRVSGFAQVAVRPDRAIMNASISVIDSTSSGAIAKLQEQTSIYFEFLEKAQFNINEVETSKYKVYVNRVDNGRTRVDSGFEASQIIRAPFSFNDSIMDIILNLFAESNLSLSLDFDYHISEELKNQVQDSLIVIASKNASVKMKTLAKANQVKVIGIKEIQYDYEPRLRSNKSTLRPVFNGYREYSRNSGLLAKKRKSFNVNPPDIIYEDVVVIFYEIKAHSYN